MLGPIWITPAGFIGTVTNSVVRSFSVTASGSGAVGYSLISGSLPTGVTLSSNGIISGKTVATVVNTSTLFVVRATDTVGKADRYFRLNIEPDFLIQWITASGHLQIGYHNVGYLLTGEKVNFYFQAFATADQTIPITYRLASGSLPTGLMIDESGLLHGIVSDTFSPANPQDTIGQPNEYLFSVAATDGYFISTSSFTLVTASPDMFRADTTNLNLNLTYPQFSATFSATVLTDSVGSLQPLVYQGTSSIIIRANSNHIIPLNDFYDADIGKGPDTYKINDTTTPPKFMSFDQASGYLYGYVNYQPSYKRIYDLEFDATKSDSSDDQQVTTTSIIELVVLGDTTANIQWISTSDLGTIYSGQISELSIQAIEPVSSYSLKYSLSQGSLPDGLSLGPDGSIAGTASYGHTGTYTFTVMTSDIFGIAEESKDFKLTVKNLDQNRYTRVYMKPFLPKDQRDLFGNFINDSAIFPTDLIYRPFDPEFGIKNEIRCYLEFGIQQESLYTYITGMFQYFKRRRFTFGAPKTAIAKDSNGNVLYEILYLDLLDGQVNPLGQSVSRTVLSDQTYYPNSLNNMIHGLRNIVLPNQAIISTSDLNLPKFMITEQTLGTGITGYISVIPICYAKPGYGTKILSLIKLSGFDFSRIDFDADRLIVENPQDIDGPRYILFPNR